MKVLVTGGTGFIGSALVRHLIAAGHEVRVLVRQKKDGFLLEHLNVEFVNGDVTSVQAVENAVQGCSVVFHLASLYAFFPFWNKNPKAIYRINVDGTVNMLAASLKYGVKRFIHTSTIATIGERPDGKPSDENTGFVAKGASHYARSKYLAEQKVLEFYQKGLPAVILNPAVVIGERDHKPTPSGDVIVKFLNRKYPGYFDARWSVADADDVVRAHIAAIECGQIGERYILSNPRSYTLKEIFQLLEKLTGIPAPRLRIPYWLLLGFTYLEEWCSQFLFHKKSLMPTEGVKFSRMSITYNNLKAVRELGYASTPIEETLATAVSWYRKNAYIEPRGFFRIKARGSRTVRRIMQFLGMDKFTDKFNLGTLFFFAIVKFLGFLRRCGIARNTDGWRKVAQCYLRTEQAKFVLAAFHLDLWSDQKGNAEARFASAKRQCLQRLARFLKAHPIFHGRLRWSFFCAVKISQQTSDLVEVDFDGEGRLLRMEPYWDADAETFESLPSALKQLLVRKILQIYNRTKDLPDKKRPLFFRKKWNRWLASRSSSRLGEWKNAAACFGERIFSAVWIRFESLSPHPSGPEAGRFQVPCFLKSKHPGFGILNIVCRFTPDHQETDFWFQFSHVPLDGVPVQEILNELKKQWGIRSRILLPDPGSRKDITPELCSTQRDKNGIYHTYQFLDFQPFLKLRHQLNRRFARRARQVISSAALLIWKLAQYKEFEDIKFAVPVDLRAMGGRERTLGFIFIRPGIYFDQHRPDRGFFDFQQEFNRQLFATRKRKSEGWQLLESYAVAVPMMYAATRKFLSNPLREFTGTLGITLIKKADFFVAPSSDVHTDGFIAFSNFSLPAANGGKVGVVSIKGPREKIQRYMNVLQDVMHRAVQDDELYF